MDSIECCDNNIITSPQFISWVRPWAYPYLDMVIMGMDWPPKSALCVIVMGIKMVQNSGQSDIMYVGTRGDCW
jgi:hypothetical protein